MNHLKMAGGSCCLLGRTVRQHLHCDDDMLLPAQLAAAAAAAAAAIPKTFQIKWSCQHIHQSESQLIRITPNPTWNAQGSVASARTAGHGRDGLQRRARAPRAGAALGGVCHQQHLRRPVEPGTSQASKKLLCNPVSSRWMAATC